MSAGITSTSTASYGAGIEWTAIQGDTRSLPVRFGYRSVALPFRFGTEDASESVVTFGFGLNLVELEGRRFGWLDVGFERGARESLPLDERFWRATFSLGIARF